MANQFLNSGASRSELLAALMDKQNRRYSQQQDPSSIGEALARTGTRFVDAFSQKKLVDDELERRKIGDAATREAYNIIGGGSFNNPSLTGNLITTPSEIVDGVQMGDVTERTLAPEQQYEPFSNQAYNAALNVNNLTSDVANTLMGQQIRSQEKLNSAQFAPKPIGSTRSVMRPKLDRNGGIINDNNGNPIMEATDVIQIFDPRTNTVKEKIIGPSANIGDTNKATLEIKVARRKLDDAVTVKEITDLNNQITSMSGLSRGYTEAINLLESGAGTGAIEQFLPSIKAETLALKQLQQQQGLDIIGSVTLGAINEKELDLVLMTAIPLGMDEQDLVAWLKSRQIAMAKMTSYLDEQVQFLSQDGATIAKWRREVNRRATAKNDELKNINEKAQEIIKRYRGE